MGRIGGFRVSRVWGFGCGFKIWAFRIDVWNERWPQTVAILRALGFFWSAFGNVRPACHRLDERYLRPFSQPGSKSGKTYIFFGIQVNKCLLLGAGTPRVRELNSTTLSLSSKPRSHTDHDPKTGFQAYKV